MNKSMSREETIRVGILDNKSKKHNQYYQILFQILRNHHIEYDEEIKEDVDYDCFLCLNLVSEEKKKPIILFDHGCSPLKFFLEKEERYEYIDYMLLSGDGIKRCIDSYIGENNITYSSIFLKSSLLLGNFDRERKYILFAPTWGMDNLRVDQISALNNCLGKQVVVSLHPDVKNSEKIRKICEEKNFLLNKEDIIELIKRSCIVISDTSSILIEASSINIPTIQLYQEKYSDNPAVFDLPYVFGKTSLFVGGIICSKLDQLSEMIEDILSHEEKYTFPYQIIRKNISSFINLSSSIDDTIFSSLTKLIKKGKRSKHLIDPSLKDLHSQAIENLRTREIYRIDEDYYEDIESEPLFLVSSKEDFRSLPKERKVLVEYTYMEETTSILDERNEEVIGILLSQFLPDEYLSALSSYGLRIFYQGEETYPNYIRSVIS